MKHVVIIGNGISGVTTARHVRKMSDQKITIISDETDYFFSRTALMYVYMGHMPFKNTQPYENWFWEKNRINLIKNRVEKIDTDSKKLLLKNGEEITYDKLVLATGSKPNKFGWKGQDLDGVSGMYSKQDLDAIEKYTKNIKRAVIVGGGLIGIELAEMLISREIPVTFLVRETSFWNNVLPKQDSQLITNHVKSHHVDLKLDTELREIIPDENGRVKAVLTSKGETIDCQFVGLTAGVSPNIDFVRDSKIECNRGILINRHLETNIPDVYAIGDCAEQENAIGRRRPIEQVWYTGRMMGETLAQTLCGNRRQYNPGHWFNSAKFFDIEYQTYGWVTARIQEDEQDYYWESSCGQKAIHLVFDKNDKSFVGINTFGIRLRHEMFDRWLNEKKSIEHVLEYLKDANFDPEFYKQHEEEIINGFNQKFNANIQPKKKSWKRIFTTF
ncbi:NAD(P)/FAD-dependent oxidoreductase [Aureivirga marina]|uniref:NAD(P)/FAD-dependent oxidoreductase n=1 Tax=Aureivirga marina TaxID=1182451 RepID=UPI0018C92C5C|nr:FAD-dependent oxidoreductase [Aureivirga marina]